MRFKFTMLMQLATNVSDPNATARRLGGWSESWYANVASVQDLYNLAFQGQAAGFAFLGALVPTRAGMLPNGAAIVGQRVQQIDPVGPSQSLSRLFPGTAGIAADIPQMALLTTTPGFGVKNIRRTILRGVPDARVIEGEYVPAGDFTRNLNQFFGVLGNWQFRGVDLSQPTIQIITIAADGTIQLAGLSAGFAVNDTVKVLRSVDQFNTTVAGKFVIQAIPSATSIQVRNWTAGVCTGGSVRKHAIIYAQVDSANCAVGRIVTKRVGRPFTQFRGRRSKRR